MEKGYITDDMLNEREAAILRAIVYEFISTGKPVGSRSFVQKYSFSISPATMRNIMYDLELSEYLEQPHTSAGRVPTDKGYRFYVDSLLDTYQLVMNEKVRIREELLSNEVQMDKIFMSVTRMLSLVSQYTGIALTPKPDFTVVKHIELVSITANEILFIMVTRTGMVIHKKVNISTNLTQDELYKFSKYLTSELGGYSIFEIKNNLIESVRQNSEFEGFIKDLSLDITELALKEEEEPDIYIDGIENLLVIPEMVEADRLRGILHRVEEKEHLKGIMEAMRKEEGVFTLIGGEIRDELISGCSIVASPYKIGNHPVGVIGIIGPTRMDYEKVVPLVDYTGRIVSDYLTKMSR